MSDPVGLVLPFNKSALEDRDPAASSPREMEIKFDVADASLDLLKAALERLGGQARSRTLSTVYYDTDDEALRRAGFALRVRQVGGRRIQTVKVDDGGLFDRGEWEQAVGPDGPDLKAACQTPLKRLLDACGPIRPQFANRMQRLERTVAYDGATIEIALDEGEIEGHGRRTPMTQLELELKSGPPEALFALARALASDAPLRLTFETKAGRGYALRDGQAPGAVKSTPVPVRRDMTVGDVFAAVAGACLRQVVANEPVLRLHRRPEALHQMRVGLRRLRSALSLFKPAIEDERYAAIKADLKWLSKQLDSARDIDVFTAETYAPALAALGREHGLAAFGKRLGRARTRSYDRALKALDSPRARAAPLAVAEWLQVGAWRVANALAPVRDRPAAEFAAEALGRLHRKIRRDGRGLAALPPAERHQLRIAGKKLRYGLEFFSALYRPKRTRRFVDRLRALQDTLGALNDIAVGHRTGAEVSRGTQAADLGFAAGLVVGLKASAEADLLKTAAKHRKGLLRTPAPWKD